MKTQTFTASLCEEEGWVVAQCLEVDVASQGKSEKEALVNLREALELCFEPPRPSLTGCYAISAPPRLCVRFLLSLAVEKPHAETQRRGG